MLLCSTIANAGLSFFALDGTLLTAHLTGAAPPARLQPAAVRGPSAMKCRLQNGGGAPTASHPANPGGSPVCPAKPSQWRTLSAMDAIFACFLMFAGLQVLQLVKDETMGLLLRLAKCGAASNAGDEGMRRMSEIRPAASGTPRNAVGQVATTTPRQEVGCAGMRGLVGFPSPLPCTPCLAPSRRPADQGGGQVGSRRCSDGVEVHASVTPPTAGLRHEARSTRASTPSAPTGCSRPRHDSAVFKPRRAGAAWPGRTARGICRSVEDSKAWGSRCANQAPACGAPRLAELCRVPRHWRADQPALAALSQRRGPSVRSFCVRVVLLPLLT